MGKNLHPHSSPKANLQACEIVGRHCIHHSRCLSSVLVSDLNGYKKTHPDFNGRQVLFLAVRGAVRKLENGNGTCPSRSRCHGRGPAVLSQGCCLGPPSGCRPLPGCVGLLTAGRAHKSAGTLPCLHTQRLARSIGVIYGSP